MLAACTRARGVFADPPWFAAAGQHAVEVGVVEGENAGRFSPRFAELTVIEDHCLGHLVLDPLVDERMSPQF